MQAMLTRCGYRCDLCLAYRPNLEANPANRQVLSDGWFKYFGFRIPAEEIMCDGCLSPDPRLIDTGCPVRPCVIERGLENCASCNEYGCTRLGERLVTYEGVQAAAGGQIPPEDYQRFIRPYENLRRLEAIRRAREEQDG